MGWYFLSEYDDFYRPGDPYGIVKWYVSGVFTVISSHRVRQPIQVKVKKASRLDLSYVVTDFLGVCRKTFT